MSSESRDFIEVVINMLKMYDRQSQHENDAKSPEEFVKNNFCEKNLFVENMQEKCVAIFFEICSLRSFLDAICRDDLLPSSPAGLVHIYLLMFYISPSNRDPIVESLSHHFSASKVENILKYFTQVDLIKIVTENSSNIYDAHIQQECILKEVKERSGLLHAIYDNFKKLQKPKRKNMCDLPIEEAHQMLLDYNQDHNAPVELEIDEHYWSPRMGTKSQANKTRLTYRSIHQTPRKLTIDLSLPLGHQPELKRARTMNKIDEDQSMASACPSTRRSRAAPEIKKTTAQVLREGARVQKKADEAEKILKDLCNGSADPHFSTKLLDEIREEENAMKLREIERKHLLGLLSREEARIAKSAVQRANRKKALELKQESQELERQLQEWRRLEMIRMREIAERNQSNIEQARLAQVNLLNKRKRTARQIQNESRELQRRIDEQRKHELDQKISLIRQIKGLEQLSKASAGKDTTIDSRSQAPSIGLSCQMSLIQLKDALIRMKLNVKEQIQRSHEKIQYEHFRQQRLVHDTMQRIERYKNVPKVTKSKVIAAKELKLTPELIKLRRKLEMKKLEAASAANF